MIKKQGNLFDISLIVIVAMIFLFIQGCTGHKYIKGGRFSYLLDRSKYNIDTLYLKTDSLIINKSMYPILDRLLKETDSFGFNKGIFKPNYLINIFYGDSSNIQIICTDGTDYLNQDVFHDLKMKIPVLGGFTYKNQCFTVFDTNCFDIYSKMFHNSGKKISLPYYNISKVDGGYVVVYSMDYNSWYKYTNNMLVFTSSKMIRW